MMLVNNGIISVILLAFLSLPIQAQQNWKDFSSDKDKNLFIDVTNIVESGNLKNFYVKRKDSYSNNYDLFKLSISCIEKK